MHGNLYCTGERTQSSTPRKYQQQTVKKWTQIDHTPVSVYAHQFAVCLTRPVAGNLGGWGGGGGGGVQWGVLN